MQHIMKNSNHVSLVSDTSIFETERHDSIIKVAHRSSESSLFRVKRVHLDLIRATETVHKGNRLVSAVASTIVYMLGKGDSSLGHALFRLQKLMQQRICPLFSLTGTIFARVLNVLNKANIQLLNLLFDLHLMISLKIPWSLFDLPSSFSVIELIWESQCASSPGISVYVPLKMSLNSEGQEVLTSDPQTN